MMSEEKKFIFKLILKQELATYLLGVPLAVYIVMFCGNFTGDGLIALLLGTLAGGSAVTPLYIFITYRRLLPIIKTFYNNSSSIQELESVKTRLMNEPQKEAFSILLCWLFAVSIAFLVMNLLIPLNTIIFILWASILMVTMPSGYIYTYFITEKEIVKLLRDNRLSSIKAEGVSLFNLLKKISMSLFTLVWYPLVIFSLILYEMQNDIVKFTNIEYHIIAIILMMLAVLFYITYTLTSSLKATLSVTNKSVVDLSRGRLDMYVPMVSSDEIGQIALLLNGLIDELKSVIKKIHLEANRLEQDSETLSEDIQSLSENSREVAASVEEISASLEELSTSSENIANNSKEQNKQTDQVYRFFGDLSHKVEEISSKASNASSISDTAVKKAVQGEDVLKETVLKIQNIEKSTEAIDDSASIIKDIADQVNMLSLNASIEAARAGEYGRGFSVVAEEISKLAERTQTNADQITKLIKETILNVSEGIDYMDRTSESFGEIEKYVRETSEIMNTIAKDAEMQLKVTTETKSNFDKMLGMATGNLRATEEQAKTHHEFISTVSRISEAIQHIADGGNKVSDFSRSLSLRAEELSKDISFFKMDE